jgi:hypothetical protein
MNRLRVCLLPVFLLWLTVLAAAQTAPIDGAWHCLDLGLLRARAAPDNAPRPAALPAGRVERGGIPMLYAGASGPWRLSAAGQRVSIAPHEGGRYYEFALAASCALPPETLLDWEVLGAGEQRAVVRARMVPAGEQLFRLIVAANFPVHGLRLPKNPALEVHAISLRWVPEGPGDVRFARAFLEQSRGDRAMARYLKQTAPGGLLAAAGHEQNRLRELFDALLAGDEAAAQTALDERLVAIDALGAASKQDRVHLCLVLPPERADDVAALAQLARALKRWPELRAAIAGSAGWQSLERSQPDRAAELRAAALEGRLELAGWQGQLDWSILPDAAAYTTAFEQGRVWAQSRGLAGMAHPGLLGDPAAQPHFVDSCLAAGRFRALIWAGGGAPRLLSLRAANGKAILGVTIPPSRREFSEDDAVALLARTAADCGAREALLPLELPSDEATLAGWVQRSIEWTEAAQGPTYLWSTPLTAFDALRKNASFRAPAGTAAAAAPAANAFLPMPLADYGTRALAEELRTVRESAWRAASFASLDGLRILRRQLEDPQATCESLEKETRAALNVLARAADTKGDGEPLLVFNLLAHERSDVVAVEARPGLVPVDERGIAIPSARDDSGRLLFRARVPSVGSALYRLVEAPAVAARAAASEVDGRWSNEKLAFRVDPASGELTSLRVLPEQIELLGGPSNRLLGMEGTVETSVVVRENNAVRLVLAITREAANARVEQELVLAAEAADLLLRTHVVRLAKGAPPRLAFRWREGSDRARVELAGGEAVLPLEGRSAGNWLTMRRFISGVRGSLGLGLVRVAQGRAALGAEEVRLELGAGAAEEMLLRPYLEGGAQIRLALGAEELASPLRVVRTDAHDGVRAGRLSFLEFGRLATGGQYAAGEQSGLVLQALRSGDLPGTLELSFRECRDEGGELELGLAARVFGVERWDAERGEWKAIRHERGKVRVPIGPRTTVRLRLKLRP